MNATKTIAAAVAALTVAGFAYAQSTTDPAITTPTPAQTVQPNSSNQATTPNNGMNSSTMNNNGSTMNSQTTIPANGMNSPTTNNSGSTMNSSGTTGNTGASTTLDTERAPQADRG